jgi:hypothetical protein
MRVLDGGGSGKVAAVPVAHWNASIVVRWLVVGRQPAEAPRRREAVR